ELLKRYATKPGLQRVSLASLALVSSSPMGVTRNRRHAGIAEAVCNQAWASTSIAGVSRTGIVQSDGRDAQ
ncbi:hypothetical protein ACNQUF_12740, partial [Corynebacterium diphtheriae]